MLTKEKTEYIKQVAANHPELPAYKLLCYMSKEMRAGTTSADIVSVVGNRKPSVLGARTPSVRMPRSAAVHKGLSREQFANTFDTDTRIRNALAKAIEWLETQEELFDDATFRTKFSCPTSGWRLVAAEQPFKRHQVVIKNKIYWVSKATKAWALNNVQGVTEL